MKTRILNIVVHANQNEVTKGEAEKIRRKVKKQFPESRIKMHINMDREYAENLEGDKITYATKDVNYIVSAFAIEFPEVTNVPVDYDIMDIKLN